MNLGHLWKRVCALLHSAARSTFLMLIALYRLFASPIFGGTCRYEPSCSVFAQEAFKTHNLFYAMLITAKRLSRCHPGGGFGFDPVPTKSCCQR